MYKLDIMWLHIFFCLTYFILHYVSCQHRLINCGFRRTDVFQPDWRADWEVIERRTSLCELLLTQSSSSLYLCLWQIKCWWSSYRIYMIVVESIAQQCVLLNVTSVGSWSFKVQNVCVCFSHTHSVCVHVYVCMCPSQNSYIFFILSPVYCWYNKCVKVIFLHLCTFLRVFLQCIFTCTVGWSLICCYVSRKCTLVLMRCLRNLGCTSVIFI